MLDDQATADCGATEPAARRALSNSTRGRHLTGETAVHRDERARTCRQASERRTPSREVTPTFHVAVYVATPSAPCFTPCSSEMQGSSDFVYRWRLRCDPYHVGSATALRQFDVTDRCAGDGLERSVETVSRQPMHAGGGAVVGLCLAHQLSYHSATGKTPNSSSNG